MPIGLIDNAWGGSAAEAWVRRETIERDARFALLMENTRKREADLQSEKGKADYAAAQAKWKENAEKAKAEKKTPPNAPPSPQQDLAGNARPGNIFAGVVNATLGYGIKGVIWYQGESNAGRAYEHEQPTYSDGIRMLARTIGSRRVPARGKCVFVSCTLKK